MDDPFAPPAASVPLPIPAVGVSGWTRLGARALDATLALCGAAVLSAIAQGSAMFASADPVPAAWFGALVGWLAVVALQWVSIAVGGASIAKQAAGIRVVRADGGPAGLVRGVIAREWAPGVLFVALLCAGCAAAFVAAPLALVAVWDVALLYSPSGVTLRDTISGTRVVRARR